MKAWVYRRFGGPEVLALETVPDPSPAPGEVVVAPRAVGLNVVDNRVRRGAMGILAGKKFPRTPGADLAGEVLAVGKNVTDFSIGDAVFGATDAMAGGALAEQVTVPARQLSRMPATIDHRRAAALPTAGLAALFALRRLGRVRKGQRVLIHGSSGGAGLFAIQLARQDGAHVTAVCGTDGVAACRAMGADVVHDYRQGIPAFDAPFDVIINFSGRLPFAAGRSQLTATGRFVEPSPTIPAVIGSTVANLLRRHQHLMLMTAARTADLDMLAGLVASDGLAVTIAADYPFDRAVDGLVALEMGGAVGKLIVTF